MKTAEKYFKGYRRLLYEQYYVNHDDFIKAINKARKEAIEECAKTAKARIIDRKAFVDKESILSLIKELK